MKTNLTILLLLLIALSVKGQQTTNQEALLKKCIDLPEIRQFLPSDQDGSMQKITIQQYPIKFEPEVQDALRNEVQFLSRESILAGSVTTFLDFRVFDIKTGHANITLSLHHQSTEKQPQTEYIQVSLHETEGAWTATNVTVRRIQP